MYRTFYFILYFIIFLGPSGCGLGYEDHTTSYPEPGECMIVKSDMYYYNAIAHGEYPCLLDYEGLLGVQGAFFFTSLIVFLPLFILRRKIWKGKRVGALPEWLVVTILYFFLLLFFTPKMYENSYSKLITLKAVLEIFYPFLIWQTIVTVGYWIYKKNKKSIKSKT